MDRMETSVDKYGQYFAKLGQKDSSSDNRALVLMTPFVLHDQTTNALLIVCPDGFRIMCNDEEAISGTVRRFKLHQENVGNQTPSSDSLGEYATTQDGLGSLRMPSRRDEDIEFKALRELPVGTDVKELIIRSMGEERARLQEFVDAEKQEEGMAKAVIITLFTNATT
jgi:hypothetical protein